MGPQLRGSPSPSSCSFPFPRPSPSTRTPRDWSASRCWRRSSDPAAQRPVSPAPQPSPRTADFYWTPVNWASGSPQPRILWPLHSLFRSSPSPRPLTGHLPQTWKPQGSCACSTSTPRSQPLPKAVLSSTQPHPKLVAVHSNQPWPGSPGLARAWAPCLSRRHRPPLVTGPGPSAAILT